MAPAAQFYLVRSYYALSDFSGAMAILGKVVLLV
jgi:hypothetical protein